MGTETKIGLTVITVLLLLFGFVLYKRLKTPDAEVEKRLAQASEKTKAKNSKSSSAKPTTQPTIVAAQKGDDGPRKPKAEKRSAGKGNRTSRYAVGNEGSDQRFSLPKRVEPREDSANRASRSYMPATDFTATKYASPGFADPTYTDSEADAGYTDPEEEDLLVSEEPNDRQREEQSDDETDYVEGNAQGDEYTGDEYTGDEYTGDEYTGDEYDPDAEPERTGRPVTTDELVQKASAQSLEPIPALASSRTTTSNAFQPARRSPFFRSSDQPTDYPTEGLGSGHMTYVVQEGDTLFDIARMELGAASRWNEIFDLNHATLGDSVDALNPGMELVLPGRAAPSMATRPREWSRRP